MGDDIYVKNRLYKGPSSGSGSAIKVGVKSIFKALKVSDYKVEGNTVTVGDKSATADAGDAEPMILLSDLKMLVGAKVIVNKELGTIDVYKDGSKAAAVAAPVSTSRKTAAPAKQASVVKAQQAQPGDKVALEDSMVFGKQNIVYFYADW